MSVWLKTASNLLMFVLGRPRGPVETVVLLVLGLAAVVTVLKAMISASRVDHGGWTRQSVAGVLGAAVIFCSAVGASIYLVPMVGNRAAGLVILVAVPVVAHLAVGALLQRLVLHAPYFETLIGFSAGVFAFAIVVFVVGAVFDSVRGGGVGFGRVRDRTHTISDFINH